MSASPRATYYTLLQTPLADANAVKPLRMPASRRLSVSTSGTATYYTLAQTPLADVTVVRPHLTRLTQYVHVKGQCGAGRRFGVETDSAEQERRACRSTGLAPPPLAFGFGALRRLL